MPGNYLSCLDLPQAPESVENFVEWKADGFLSRLFKQ